MEKVPTIDELLTVSDVDWIIKAITDVVITCKRADVEGEPKSHLQIFTFPRPLYERVKAGEYNLKMKADKWGRVVA